MPASDCTACRLSFTICALILLHAISMALNWRNIAVAGSHWTFIVPVVITFLVFVMGLVASRKRMPKLLNFYAGVQTAFLILEFVASAFLVYMLITHYGMPSAASLKPLLNFNVISNVVSCLFILILKIRSIALARRLSLALVEEAKQSQDIELASPAQAQEQVVVVPQQLFQQSYFPVSQDSVQLVPIYIDQHGNPIVQVHQ